MRKSNLIVAALAFLAFAAFFAAPARAQDCVFSGITTASFDDNRDDYYIMELGFDAGSCGLTIEMKKNSPFFIGNYYLVQHFLIYGESLIEGGFTLDPPFMGHDLQVLPIDVVGPFIGTASDNPLPNDPNLVGLTFYTQGIAVFLYTLQLPGILDYVLTNGVALTLN